MFVQQNQIHALCVTILQIQIVVESFPYKSTLWIDGPVKRTSGSRCYCVTRRYRNHNWL